MYFSGKTDKSLIKHIYRIYTNYLCEPRHMKRHNAKHPHNTQTGSADIPTAKRFNATDITANQSLQLFINHISLNGFINFTKNKNKQNNGKRSAWICSCGCIIPKKGAKLSGGPQYKQGYHIHCPQYAKTVAQFINPSETQ